jgi:hypothetical protein
MATCSWPLGNGQYLSFNIYSENKNWNKVSGLYIFSYLASNGKWCPLYVGQTDDFSSRPANHERLDEAVRLGATHIHALVVPLQSDRNRFEEMLIQNLQPPMNTQMKKASNY